MSEVTPVRWSTAAEAARLWFARSTLSKTLKICVIVGTLLSAIDQGSVILGGTATWRRWIRSG
jgi:hypothetical protein